MVAAKIGRGGPKTVEYHLKRFQPGNMQTNRVCIMVGKKGTGKSSLVQDLLWFQQHIPVGAIMSGTEETNEAYSKMAPPLFIYKDFDADALLRLINRQKKMKSMYKQNGDSLPFDHRAFVLMDDCMYDKKNFKSPLMRELFMNGRHWDLFVLITLQYIMDITPDIRTNTDYVFALKENIRKNRERMYNEFFGVFPSFPVFDALFLEVTQDYRCLVLDNTKPSTKIEDCVFWYKAEPRPPFKLGAEWYWEYSEQNARARGVPDQNEANQLEEMNQKAVRVVYEGKRPPPTQPKPNEQDKRNPLLLSPRRPSQVQFRNQGGGGGGRPPVQNRRYEREGNNNSSDHVPEYGYEYRNDEYDNDDRGYDRRRDNRGFEQGGYNPNPLEYEEPDMSRQRPRANGFRGLGFDEQVTYGVASTPHRAAYNASTTNPFLRVYQAPPPPPPRRDHFGGFV